MIIEILNSMAKDSPEKVICAAAIDAAVLAHQHPCGRPGPGRTP